MKPKIIIADDSLTIQKVIKITLANEDFDLVECLDESSLASLIQENSPIVALLDFNLSENKTGYDLAREIRDLGVSKVLMLYGTFDTVDEKLLEHSGVSAHIIKPFEGTKFINLCRQLVEDVSLEATEPSKQPVYEEEISQDFPDPIVSEEDQWGVNQPNIIEAEEIEDEFSSDEVVSSAEMNSLQAGMQEWGIDVPGVIGNTNEKQYALVDLPPVIEDEFVEESADNFVENDAPSDDDDIIETPIKAPIEIELSATEEIPAQIETITETVEEALPASEDLEYPDIDMIKSAVEAEVLEPKSKLISVAELATDNADEQFYDDSVGTKTEEEILDLKAQIADEIEDNFWSADEVIENPNSVPEAEDNSKVEEVVKEIEVETVITETHTIDEDEEEVVSKDKVEALKVDLNEFDSEKILEMIEPIVQRLVEKRVQEIIEKVAWEVIPDLSENLIKKEIEKISKTILDSKK